MSNEDREFLQGWRLAVQQLKHRPSRAYWLEYEMATQATALKCRGLGQDSSEQWAMGRACAAAAGFGR